MRRQRVQRPFGRIAALLALMASFGTGAGCQYATERGRDFLDIVSLGISDGGGVLIRVLPTRFLALEAGGRKDETFYGFRNRRYHWLESSYGLPIAFFWSPRMGEELFANWGWLDLIKTSHTKLLYRDVDAVGEPHGLYEERRYHLFVLTDSEHTQTIDNFDLEAEASALIVGVHVGVGLGQLVDFLGGIVGVDLAGDDHPSAPPQDPAQGQGQDAAASTPEG